MFTMKSNKNSKLYFIDSCKILEYSFNYRMSLYIFDFISLNHIFIVKSIDMDFLKLTN